MRKNVKIIVNTHIKYEMPKDDIYLPLYVGAARSYPKFDIQTDNKGKNISNKNSRYCELTGIYWMWKNLEADYYGVVHYRRYFKGSEEFNVKGKTKKILSSDDVDKVFDKYDVVLPSKRMYFIESIYSHYSHTMYVEPLNVTGEVIKEKYPEYFKEFEKLKTRRSAHLFNLFIMKKDLFDKYCEWLFSILDEVDKRVDASKFNDFHSRYIGRISEMLLDIWINTNNIKYKEIPFIDIEGKNLIKKAFAVIYSKFFKKKYEKSF
ncbi:MAG: DUF4422 domain-containing protein [Clostridia bacterium]|nr:DUF4422 domain-containing protein [Clostridia bacterium]